MQTLLTYVSLVSYTMWQPQACRSASDSTAWNGRGITSWTMTRAIRAKETLKNNSMGKICKGLTCSSHSDKDWYHCITSCKFPDSLGASHGHPISTWDPFGSFGFLFLLLVAEQHNNAVLGLLLACAGQIWSHHISFQFISHVPFWRYLQIAQASQAGHWTVIQFCPACRRWHRNVQVGTKQTFRLCRRSS